MTTSKLILGSCAAILISCVSASATTLDLTTVSSGTLNGGLFQLSNGQPTGTGVFDPFLTIQNKTVEQGYNSSTGNFDTKREPVWNHEIKLSDLNVTTLNGIAYYSFDIDINEPNGGTTSTISLDKFKVYTSSTLQTSTSTNSNGVFNGSLGTLRYDMGTNNWVHIDDVNHGSGQFDLSIFIPVSNFGNAAASDYVYVYQFWGSNFNTEGGYEETAIGGAPGFTAIPEPSALLPLMAVLGTVGAFHRQRRKAASAPAA